MILRMLAVLAFVFAFLGHPSTPAYSYVRGPVLKGVRAACPGNYCGRSPLNATHVSECGRCQRGWRVADNVWSLCQLCEDAPSFYDWLFLAFEAIFVLVLHLYSIDLSVRQRGLTREVVAVHCCALFEVTLAAVASLLLFRPAGSLSLASCRPRRLADWYSLFYNPTPNYEETLRCGQETVYPLVTLVITFYALCVAATVVIRPLVANRLLRSGPSRRQRRAGRSSVYATLYYLPVLALTHAAAGGLIYHWYPYLVLAFSLITSAGHLAQKLDQSPRALVMSCVLDARSLCIVLGHWALHAFGVVAVTQLQNLPRDLALLALVPLPTVFYVLTVRWTDPSNFLPDTGH